MEQVRSVAFRTLLCLDIENIHARNIKVTAGLGLVHLGFPPQDGLLVQPLGVLLIRLSELLLDGLVLNNLVFQAIDCFNSVTEGDLTSWVVPMDIIFRQFQMFICLSSVSCLCEVPMGRALGEILLSGAHIVSKISPSTIPAPRMKVGEKRRKHSSLCP